MQASSVAIVHRDQFSLSSLPSDVLYHVIDFIDEPYDLSRLASASKSLHLFITSNALYFRRIRCELGQTVIWSLLKTDVFIASRIRKLELLPSHHAKPLLPPLCRAFLIETPAKDKDSLLVFKKALANMINLIELSWQWSRNMPPEEGLGLCLDLAFCGKDIQKLRISHFGMTLSLNPSCRYRNPETNIDHLTIIDISLPCLCDLDTQLENANTPNGERLLELIIRRCPNLEDLSLSFVSDAFSLFAPGIFVDAHWPNLRRLSLNGYITCLPEDADLAAKSTILNAFWSRHPDIEHLLLRFNQYYKLDIQPGLLPKLKSLSGYLGPKFSAISTDVLARIEHLCDMTKALPCPRFPISYFKNATSLTSLVVTILDEEWEQLLSNHPTITRFACARQRLIWPDYANKRVQSILKTLSGMPHLTHLYLFKISFDTRSKGLSILSQFPNLKYLRGLQGSDHWYVLDRDLEGNVAEWHPTEEALNVSLSNVDDWGCDITMQDYA